MDSWEFVVTTLRRLHYLSEDQKIHVWRNIRQLYYRASDLIGSSPSRMVVRTNERSAIDALGILPVNPWPVITSAAEEERYHQILKYNIILRNIISSIDLIVGDRIGFPDAHFLGLFEGFKSSIAIAAAPPSTARWGNHRNGQRETRDNLVPIMEAMAYNLRWYFWSSLERLINEVSVRPVYAFEHVRVDLGRVSFYINNEVVWTRMLWDYQWVKDQYPIEPCPRNINIPSDRRFLRELRSRDMAMKRELDVRLIENVQNLLDWIAHSVDAFAVTEEDQKRDIWEPIEEDEVTSFPKMRRREHDFLIIKPSIKILRRAGGRRFRRRTTPTASPYENLPLPPS